MDVEGQDVPLFISVDDGYADERAQRAAWSLDHDREMLAAVVAWRERRMGFGEFWACTETYLKWREAESG